MCNFSLGQCSWGQIIRKALRVNFQEILSGGNFPGVIIQEAIIRGQFSSGVVVRGDNFPQGQLSSGVIFWTAITWGQSSREGVAIFLGGNCPDTVFTLHIGSMLIYFVVVLETKKLLIHLLLTWLIYRSSY